MWPTRGVWWREGIAWRILLLLWALEEKPVGVRCSVARCTPGDSACRFFSVSNLFDRVKYFLPGGNELAKSVGKCHISWLLTPNAKEYAQKIPMQSMGIICNLLNGVGSSEAVGLSINNGDNLMSDYEFVHCFRRDSNKVQNYL